MNKPICPARIRAAFLLLPKTINGQRRHLVRATWLEHRTEDGWKAVAWVELSY